MSVVAEEILFEAGAAVVVFAAKRLTRTVAMEAAGYVLRQATESEERPRLPVPGPKAPALLGTVPTVKILSRTDGRIRFNVEGLRGDAARARVLLDTLQAHPGVRFASASELTGNMLVRYDPAQTTPESIMTATTGR